MNFLIKFRTLFHGDESHDIQKSFEEKRCYPRAKCSFNARCLLPDKTELSVLISEVSASGMRLRSERKMQSGDIIVVEPERREEAFSENEHEGHSVKMKVIWNKKKQGTDYYVVGLHYADNRKNLQDSWAASLLKKFGISVELMFIRGAK